jgi:drug/metabolite transporter (DMT)-like permease
MRTDASLKPVFAAALGVGLFSLLDAMMKVIATAYPLAQSSGMRYAAGAMAAIVYYMLTVGRAPTAAEVLRSLPRAACILLAGTCFFFALARLPLIDAIALSFLSPLFLGLFSWALLGEKLRLSTIAAMLMGLAGVFVIAQGHRLDENKAFEMLGFVAAIATAGFYALSMVLTRKQGAKDPVPTLVMLPITIGALVTAGPMIMVWQPVETWHWPVLALVGVTGTAAHLCISWAYANSRVGRLGLLEYTGLVWGALFGYLLFRESPSAFTIAGAVIIVAACLPAFRKETA